MNWRGQVLDSYEVIVNLMIQSELDSTTYETGIKVTKAEMKQIPLVPHEFHEEWNYTHQETNGRPCRRK
jgi:Rhodopirellula transposase DDE domain